MRFSPGVSDLFLDFDGVLCDSLEECFRSSWLTLTGAPLDDSQPPEPSFGPDYRARFNACRPFIRSGEDYLVVHEWAARGLVPRNQAEFDQSLQAKGPEALATMKTKLYAVRDQLLARHRSSWLAWNPLYPGVAEALKLQVTNPRVWILSTKKAEFIVQILGHHGVSWPLERTLYTGTQKKLDLIHQRIGTQPSVLIDDQIEHLDFHHPSCACFLALWGYVAPGVAAQAAATLTLPEALEEIRSFPHPRRAG